MRQIKKTNDKPGTWIRFFLNPGAKSKLDMLQAKDFVETGQKKTQLEFASQYMEKKLNEDYQ